MSDAIPPPPPRPQELSRPSVQDFAIPQVRVWFYAGPIIVDVTAMVMTTLLVALGKLEVEAFKYLVGVLVVGNVALRMPGLNKPNLPGGGGFIVAFLSSAITTLTKGFKP